MGQKVNPNGLRIGIIKDWNSKWYADKKDIAKFIKEDEVVRTFIKKKYYQSAISSIKIERSEGKIVIFIYTGRPGTLIGKQGAGIEQMKAEVQKLVGDKFVVINIMEVKNPDMDAQLVAENIAAQLERESRSGEPCAPQCRERRERAPKVSKPAFPVVSTERK